MQGWSDTALNAQGERQALELARAFAGAGFAEVYASSLRRALDTATTIADGLGLPAPTCHDGLMERHFGAIQGVPKLELAQSNPVLLQQILKRNPACDFEQGESMDEFASRVLEAVMNIGRDHVGERVLIITHGWVMDVITRHIRGLPRHAILNLKRKNGEWLWLQARGETIAPLNTG